jgi:membrane associated rhomboid family serine protease
VFPIGDNEPRKRFPIVVLLLVAVNCYVFFREFALGPEGIESFINAYGLIPARDLGPPFNLKPFMTSMFLHGGFLHLIFNMWSFWIFGDNVEGLMGSFKFAFFYLLCGLAAALTQAFLAPGSEVPMIGASGAIAGVMGAYLFAFPRARIRMFTLLIFYPLFFEIPAFVFLALWFLGQLMSGTMTLHQAALSGQDVGGIAFFAHVGGFVAGIVLSPFFRSAKARK